VSIGDILKEVWNIFYYFIRFITHSINKVSYNIFSQLRTKLVWIICNCFVLT
jgi:hypothetical protein